MHFSPYPTYFLICMKLNFSVFLLPMATTHSFFCLCYSFFLFWDSFPRILLFPFSSLTISSHLFQLKDFFVQDSLYPLPSSKLLTTYGRLSANNHLNILLKGKLRHTNIFFFEVYLSKHCFRLGSAELKVIRSTPPMGTRDKVLYRSCGSKAKKLFDW